jgi:hypothetical protein
LSLTDKHSRDSENNPLRKVMLAFTRSTPLLDEYELSLFAWYLKDSEEHLEKIVEEANQRGQGRIFQRQYIDPGRFRIKGVRLD